MKPTSVNRTTAVIFAMLLTISLSSTSFGAENGEADIEKTVVTHGADSIVEPQFAEAAVLEKAMICGDNFCSGLYGELVDKFSIWQNGNIIITPTSEVFNAMNQSSLGCDTPLFLYIQDAAEPFGEKRNAAVGRLTNLLTSAKTLGSSILIVWEQTGNIGAGACSVHRIDLLD